MDDNGKGSNIKMLINFNSRLLQSTMMEMHNQIINKRLKMGQRHETNVRT
jgi:hypothetical protein